MVARYKVTKFRDKWNDGFFKPKYSNPDSVERQQARQELHRELVEQHINKDLVIREEARIDRIESQAWECYRMELAGHPCKCFED